MSMKPVYVPPLSSECDTQFFSKEFTKMPVLNPEDDKSGLISGESVCQTMDCDLECLYNNVHTADYADN